MMTGGKNKIESLYNKALMPNLLGAFGDGEALVCLSSFVLEAKRFFYRRQKPLSAAASLAGE